MKARTVGGLIVLFLALASAHAALNPAGDLDGDGRLDFIVESARDDGGTNVELWLSDSPSVRYGECRAGC